MTIVKRPAAKESALATKRGTAVKKVAKKAVVKRNPLPAYKAPVDFKPHFLLVSVKTEKDGLLASSIKATRFQGQFNREADDKKKFELAAYDQNTLVGIMARFSAVSFKPTNDKKMSINPKERMALKGSMRLPASTGFQILLRVGKKAADQSLTSMVRSVFQAVKSEKTGKVSLKELDKTDPAYRTFRKASRILPAAFQNVLHPPKRTRISKVVEE